MWQWVSAIDTAVLVWHIWHHHIVGRGSFCTASAKNAAQQLREHHDTHDTGCLRK